MSTAKLKTIKSDASGEAIKSQYEAELQKLQKRANEIAHILEKLNPKSSVPGLDKTKENINEMFCNLTERTELPIKVLSEYVFEITPKTFNTYKTEKQLPSHILEKTVKLNELYSKGEELFGTVSQFNKWLNKELYSLDNLIPFRLMNTVIGIDKVLDELYNIEFGTPA